MSAVYMEVTLMVTSANRPTSNLPLEDGRQIFSIQVLISNQPKMKLTQRRASVASSSSNQIDGSDEYA